MLVGDQLLGAIDRTGSSSSVRKNLNCVAPRVPPCPGADQRVERIDIGDAVGVRGEARIVFECVSTDDLENALGDLVGRARHANPAI